jgi:outer membrane usher protein
MPQRHHQGHKRTPKQLALIIKRCLPMVLTGSGMLCTTANAEEYYFDPIMLETTKSGMQTTDLSRFSKKYAQLPGTYQVCGAIKHFDPCFKYQRQLVSINII